jgi:hypothetical protein
VAGREIGLGEIWDPGRIDELEAGWVPEGGLAATPDASDGGLDARDAGLAVIPESAGLIRLAYKGTSQTQA